MKRHRMEITGPGKVFVHMESAPEPATDEVLVKTRWSAVSAGTEMLVYRGEWPSGVAVDSTIASLSGDFTYPLSYGYCTVGQVVATGSPAFGDWLGRRVFAFQPHQDLFCVKPANLQPIADDIDDETALFLPSMETAVNLVLDGNPLIGEQVIVVGQGIIGLLTTALLSRFPLARLSVLDAHSLRRETALSFGADESFDPVDPTSFTQLGGIPGQGGKADIVYELSGNPMGLDMATGLCRFSGRVVVGSWYGTKKVNLDLGSFFHRGRLSLISSQVSTVAPGLTGRWSHNRRLDLAWEMLRQVRPARCITHRFALADAALAYSLIDRKSEETIQVIFDHKKEK